MAQIVCPKCQNRTTTQDATKPTRFICSKCGEFVLLPAKPDSSDVDAVWGYLIEAGKHLKELQRSGKI